MQAFTELNGSRVPAAIALHGIRLAKPDECAAGTRRMLTRGDAVFVDGRPKHCDAAARSWMS